MYEYYSNYVDSQGDPDAQARWARQFTWEVARHAVGEEIVIYPLMEKHLGEQGKKLADDDRADHQVRGFFSSLTRCLWIKTVLASQAVALKTRNTLAGYCRALCNSERHHGSSQAT